MESTAVVDAGNARSALVSTAAEATRSIARLYEYECDRREICAHEDHVLTLQNVPEILHVPINLNKPPDARSGGVCINASRREDANPATERQLSALLDTLFCRGAPLSGGVLLVNHLDLSGCVISIEMLEGLVKQAKLLGQWWQLRSLVLRGCGLTLEHLRVLCSDDAITFMMHLERLDISQNRLLGSSAEGRVYEVMDFVGIGGVLLANLWQNAPLKHLDLTGCQLKSEVLIAMMRIIRSADPPSVTGCCGIPWTDGVRSCLQSFHLGPLQEDGRWRESDTLFEMQQLISALPHLSVLTIYGDIDDRSANELREYWQQNLLDGTETDQGVLMVAGESGEGLPFRRFCLEREKDGLLVEKSPSQHIMPEMITPPKVQAVNEDSDDDPARHVLDDWSFDLLVRGVDRIGEESREEASRAEAVLHPKRYTMKNINLNSQPLLPPRRPRSRQTKKRTVGTSDSASRNASLATPRKRCMVSPRMYRGGLIEDDLPYQDIDLASDENYMEELSESDLHESEDSMDAPVEMDSVCIGYHELRSPSTDPVRLALGRDQGIGKESRKTKRTRFDDDSRNYPVQSHHWLCADAEDDIRSDEGRNRYKKGFRVRDGVLDEDSRLGKVYKKIAKRLAGCIPDESDRKRAMAAFRIWDKVAINAWDQRRWENPSKDQDDAPHLLGQLNLLYDLLDKHGLLHELKFPFPKWIRGGSSTAFDPMTDAIEVAGLRRDADIPGFTARYQTPFFRGKDGADKTDAVDIDGDESEEEHVGRTQRKTFKRVIDDDDDEEEEEDLNPNHKPETCYDSLDKSYKRVFSDKLPGSCDIGIQVVLNADKLLDIDANINGKQNDSCFSGAVKDALVMESSTQHTNKQMKRARELRMLSAWSWDAQRDAYPPNQEYYEVERVGPRRRRQHFTSSQWMELLTGSEEQVFNPTKKSNTQRNNEMHLSGTSTDDSDDDLPLGELIKISRAEIPGFNAVDETDSVPTMREGKAEMQRSERSSMGLTKPQKPQSSAGELLPPLIHDGPSDIQVFDCFQDHVIPDSEEESLCDEM